MGGKDHSMLSAYLAQILELLQGPQAWVGREDVGETIVVPPSLPGMQDNQAMCETVFRRQIQFCRDVFVRAAPYVESEKTRQTIHARGFGERGHPLIPRRRSEWISLYRNKVERTGGMGVKRILLFVRIGGELVGWV